MNDGMTSGLSWWIITLSVGNILFMVWLIWWTARISTGDTKEGEKMGHSWDGIVELNNPMPSWWLGMFWLSIVFAVIYLALYPGLGLYKGLLGWTGTGQWETEMAKAREEYDPKFAALASGSIAEVAANPEAMKSGHRLFLTYCSVCHGTTASGAVHFPNLADEDWLWGGAPETIQTTILDGRNNQMPAMIATLGTTDEERAQGEEEVINYVLSLSGRDHDPALATAGKQKFMFCMGCHGPEGKGTQALGAPNLTDSVWLHGRKSDKAVRNTIHTAVNQGFTNQMPSFRDFLGEDKVKVLAAYVYSLSQPVQ